MRYVIGVDGKLRDVTIDKTIPKGMNDFIINWFENLRGWKPRIHMNRKVPKYMVQPVNFKKKE